MVPTMDSGPGREGPPSCIIARWLPDMDGQPMPSGRGRFRSDADLVSDTGALVIEPAFNLTCHPGFSPVPRQDVIRDMGFPTVAPIDSRPRRHVHRRHGRRTCGADDRLAKHRGLTVGIAGKRHAAQHRCFVAQLGACSAAQNWVMNFQASGASQLVDCP
jgi:hypothetical protein